MATEYRTPVPGWWKVVTLLAVVWNAFGVIMYLSSVGVFGDPTANLSEAERAVASSIPDWVTGAFAIGVFAGLIGSIGLFLRKSWAVPVLIVSLVATLIMEGWIIFASDAAVVSGVALPIVVSICSVLLAWLAVRARNRGWLTA